MSRLFGPMRQMGYVVLDLEAAMRHWAEDCGIGPWFWFERSAYDSFTYQGRRYDDIHISVAFANSGDIQIELIQQRCRTPSMYMDFLRDYPQGGVQHWSSWPVDFEVRRQSAIDAGYEVAMEGTHARGPFVYFRDRGFPGSIIEMSELTPGRAKFFDMVRDEGARWDGSNPIRRAA